MASDVGPVLLDAMEARSRNTREKKAQHKEGRATYNTNESMKLVRYMHDE
jgi:hypothetical protein